MNVEKNNKSDTIIETPRLIVRQWRASDLEPMLAINQDPRVMEYFITQKTFAETNDFIASNLNLHEQLGYSLYAVEIKDDGEFIGFVGLRSFNAIQTSAPAVEIDWLIAPKFWGQGHSTEAAKAIMDYAFNALNIDELVSTVPIFNIIRTKKLIRFGFVQIESENFNHPKIVDSDILRRHAFYRKHNTKRDLRRS